jgi:3-deoxy-D-manno-octulosonic-acid transferase
MGEMVAYHSMADVAVIGGSLLPFGGQNLIEAAACGVPLIIGPHTYNFSAAAMAAEKVGAATRLAKVTPTTLAQAVSTLLRDQIGHQRAAVATAAFVSEATGATNKLLALIAKYLRP